MHTIRPKYIVTFIALVFVAGISWYVTLPQNIGPEKSTIDEQYISVSIAIDGVAATTTLPIAPTASVLGVLHYYRTLHPETIVETKTYNGLGTLVEAIGPYRNGDDGNYWQYYVNGIQPLVAADAYIIKDGDTVVWIFNKSEM